MARKKKKPSPTFKDDVLTVVWDRPKRFRPVSDEYEVERLYDGLLVQNTALPRTTIHIVIQVVFCLAVYCALYPVFLVLLVKALYFLFPIFRLGLLYFLILFTQAPAALTTYALFKPFGLRCFPARELYSFGTFPFDPANPDTELLDDEVIEMAGKLGGSGLQSAIQQLEENGIAAFVDDVHATHERLNRDPD